MLDQFLDFQIFVIFKVAWFLMFLGFPILSRLMFIVLNCFIVIFSQYPFITFELRYLWMLSSLYIYTAIFEKFEYEYFLFWKWSFWPFTRSNWTCRQKSAIYYQGGRGHRFVYNNSHQSFIHPFSHSMEYQL